MKKEIIKTIAVSIGAFGVIVLGNIAAQSIYARTGVSADKKALTISLLGGAACAGLIAWGIKK